VLASTFHAGGPIAYGRDGNPTWTALEEVIGVLEGGAALAFASGMAAVSALFDLVPVGGAVVVPRDGFYGTRALLAAASRAASPRGRSTSPTPTRRSPPARGPSCCSSSRPPTR